MSPLPKIYGHKAQLETIQKAFSADRFPHAWIFSGPKGIGKKLAALHCAHYVFSQSDSPDDVAKKMAVNAYPDFLLIEPALNDKGELKDAIAADEVRKINDFVQQTTFAQAWRVILIDGADLMNRHASNAVLKVLEDPPKNTVFFLVTHSKGALLQTIISRCQMLSFRELSQKDFQNVLDVDDQTAEDHYKIVGGVPGEARDMLDPEIADLIGGLQRRLEKDNIVGLYKTMKGFASSATHMNVLKKIVLRWAHDKVVLQSDKAGGYAFNQYADAYASLSNLFDQEKRFSLDRAQTIACVYFELKKFSNL